MEEDLGGQIVRGYELREKVGTGGFDAVYRAYQKGVDREVASRSSSRNSSISPNSSSGSRLKRAIKDENGVSLGVGYPFYPGGWKEVIAVSAGDDADHFAVASLQPASYSNAGRVIMGGTWEPGLSVWPWTGTLDDYPQLDTSFAAPRYSFVVAMILAQAQNMDVGCGMGVLPPIADPVSWYPTAPPANRINQSHCNSSP